VRTKATQGDFVLRAADVQGYIGNIRSMIEVWGQPLINHKYSPIAEIRQNSPRRDAMIKFDKEQKVFDIAGVKVGGQPGEYPTVLIGSIFHQKHKIVSDPSKGEFDVAAAQSLIKKNEELYDKTGNPFILDVVATNANALMKYIEFVADVTDAPFLVDGPSADVRLQAMRRAVEIGIRNRVIYNSLDYRFSSEEVSELKEIGVESSMLLAYSPRNVWAEGRLEMLESQPRRMGLLEASENAGIKNRLVDTAVLDAPSMGFSAKSHIPRKGEVWPASWLCTSECGHSMGEAEEGIRSPRVPCRDRKLRRYERYVLRGFRSIWSNPIR